MMKKITRTIVACACAAALAGSMASVAACSDSDEIKIGVLVSDVSGDEAVAFQNYYTQYIAEQYDVTITYTSALSDSAGEISAIETFAGQNYDAIISLSSSDRASQIEACEEYGMYYAIASGMDDGIYETYKDYNYFVGQIGPSMETEYDAGYAMGEWFLENDYIEDSVAIYGAFIPNSMHVYRFAGLLTALGGTYNGKSGTDIVSEISSSVDSSLISIEGVTVYYFAGYGDDTTTTLNTIIAADPDAFLSVGMATTFFASSLNSAGIPYGDIDSFTSTNATNMSSGSLAYLAGKYTSSIGPIFAAVYNAIQGNKIETSEGYAISISQDYWVAASYSEFQLFQSADSYSDPIINKELLDTIIGDDVTYEQFEAFVLTDRTPSAS